MARLNNMMNHKSDLIEEVNAVQNTDGDENNETLVEALYTLIDMIEENALNEDELEILDTTIDFLSEDFDIDEDDEDLTEAKKLKRMSAKDRMAARRYRMKNKAKLKMAAKKRKLKDKKLKKRKDACKKKGMVYSKRKGGCARPMERR